MTESNSQTTAATDTQQILFASVAPAWWIRAVLVSVLMLGLGLWGLYDYAIGIPAQEQMAQRRKVAEGVKLALEQKTKDAVDIALADTAAQAGQGVGQEQDVEWDETLAVWNAALQSVAATGQMPAELMLQSGTRLENAMELYGDVQEPAAYDRPVQWMFIGSLVFVPFYVFGLIKYAPKKYSLDPDGTVHLPNETLAATDIQDIDMDRWMAKSTAELVTVDGRRIKLDAFIFKNLHLIIGSVANRLHPDAWTSEGKPVKSDGEPDPQLPNDGEEGK
ncbi:MAG: hypothetical protein MK095_06080 [Phycisphaerales bacterium]|nr:hypothetical protein [Phycisphaerales bacterium]